LLELILTWWLVVVIMSVATGAKEKGLFAGIAIGATVALEAMFAGPITGASMNPARSIGPALLSGELHDLWLYIVAPMLGALLAVATCRHIHSGPCCEPE
jgi:aquaporin NIP